MPVQSVLNAIWRRHLNALLNCRSVTVLSNIQEQERPRKNSGRLNSGATAEPRELAEPSVCYWQTCRGQGMQLFFSCSGGTPFSVLFIDTIKRKETSKLDTAVSCYTGQTWARKLIIKLTEAKLYISINLAKFKVMAIPILFCSASPFLHTGKPQTPILSVSC